MPDLYRVLAHSPVLAGGPGSLDLQVVLKQGPRDFVVHTRTFEGGVASDSGGEYFREFTPAYQCWLQRLQLYRGQALATDAHGRC